MNHFGPIPTLIVDLSPFCDLQCPMCPQGQGSRGSRRPMSPEIVEAVIAGLANHKPGAGAILPFWNGEPLLSDNFSHFVTRLHNERTRGTLNFGVISIHTNATRLHNTHVDLILTPGLFGPVTISLDAADTATYAGIRRGGDFSTVDQQVKNFILQRCTTGLPAVILQFIAMAENEGNEVEFVRHWQKFFQNHKLPAPHLIFDECNFPQTGDVLFIRALIPASETSEDINSARGFHERARTRLLPEVEVIQPTNVKESHPPPPAPSTAPRRGPCPGIFQHLGIDWQGNVSPCCRDFEVRMRLGNVLETSLAELWTGPTLRDWRIAHVEGRFNDVPLCGNCPGQPFGVIHPPQVVDWLKSVGQECRINPYLRRLGTI